MVHVFISGKPHRQSFLPVSTSEILQLFAITGRKNMYMYTDAKNQEY